MHGASNIAIVSKFCTVWNSELAIALHKCSSQNMPNWSLVFSFPQFFSEPCQIHLNGLLFWDALPLIVWCVSSEWRSKMNWLSSAPASLLWTTNLSHLSKHAFSFSSRCLMKHCKLKWCPEWSMKFKQPHGQNTLIQALRTSECRQWMLCHHHGLSFAKLAMFHFLTKQTTVLVLPTVVKFECSCLFGNTLDTQSSALLSRPPNFVPLPCFGWLLLLWFGRRVTMVSSEKSSPLDCHDEAGGKCQEVSRHMHQENGTDMHATVRVMMRNLCMPCCHSDCHSVAETFIVSGPPQWTVACVQVQSGLHHVGIDNPKRMGGWKDGHKRHSWLLSRALFLDDLLRQSAMETNFENSIPFVGLRN